MTVIPLAMIDGEVMPLAEASIPVTDLGLLRGYGAFEVVAVHDGRPVFLQAHLDRLARSAARLMLPLDAATIRRECDAFLAHVAGPAYEVRLVVTASGRRIFIEEPLPEMPDVFRLAPVEHVPGPLLAGVKSTSYAANMLAREIARSRGCDDALLVSPVTGRVLEGPTTTFAWVEDGVLYTPPLQEGVLASITRQAAIEATDMLERPCTLETIRGADEACVMGTGIDARPVSEVLGVAEFPLPATTIAALNDALGRQAAVG